jgi:peptide deformylase
LAVREVLRMGDPRLRVMAAPVCDLSKGIEAVVADMLDTMRSRDGAGLAAPQIGVPLRIVVFGIEVNPRYPDAPPVPLTTLVNPVIEPVDDGMEDGWEGCLSVPGMRGLVPRHSRIRYRGQGLSGEWIERTAEGFHARVVQHECDHLDGVLYPDRIRDRRMFGFIEPLHRAGLLGDTLLPEE